MRASITINEGEVHSDTDKELAENIALGVEGIDSVTNKIKVIEKPAKVAKSTTPKDDVKGVKNNLQIKP